MFSSQLLGGARPSVGVSCPTGLGTTGALNDYQNYFGAPCHDNYSTKKRKPYSNG